MKPGRSRFEFHLLQAEELMHKSSASLNPALWLYQNNARTCFFMLEGLAKLYAGLHNPKKFGKILDHAKLIEDGIGMIDYYDHVAQDLLKLQGMPEIIIAYAQAQAREKIQRLNDILREKKWIGENATRFKKIREKLDEADWMEAEAECTAIRQYYLKEIEEIELFMPERFTEMELEVHSMRRKLRWLSIYPQAMQGAIQYNDNNEADSVTEKYLTKEIIDSAFNKLPEAGQNEYVLRLEKKYFLCLSWMIAETGRIKDDGLNILAIAEALEASAGMKQEDAIREACRISGKDAGYLDSLLDKATVVCRDFLHEGHLRKLIAGVYPASAGK